MTGLEVAGIAGAAASLLGAGGNMYVQGKSNQATRDFNENMYHVQRAHNIEDWMRQNAYNEAYNSPTAQMERLRAAGLNPHLMYGNGGMANTNAAGMPKSTPAAPYRDIAPQIPDLGNVVDGYMNAKLMDAQVQQINQNILASKSAQSLTEITAAQRAYKLGLDSEMRRTILDQATANLEKTQAATNQIGLNNTFGWQTFDDRAKGINLRNITEQGKQQTEQLKQQLIKAQIGLTNEQTQNVARKTVNMGYEAQVIMGKATQVLLQNELTNDQRAKIRREIEHIEKAEDQKTLDQSLDILKKIIPSR